MEKVEIKALPAQAREAGFMEEYKALTAKWGIDFQPAYRLVDLVALNANSTQLEAVEESHDKKKKGKK